MIAVRSGIHPDAKLFIIPQLGFYSPQAQVSIYSEKEMRSIIVLLLLLLLLPYHTKR